MFRLRRSNPDLRLDITPMIDVVFLLLTFFLFAFVVMVRARTLDVNLPDTGRVSEGEQRATITLSLTADRRVALDGLEFSGADMFPGDAVDTAGFTDGVDGAGVAQNNFAAMVARVEQMLLEQPDARILLAADRDAPSGDLLELIDALTAAGITEFSVLGRAEGEPSSSQTPAAFPEEAP